MYPKIFQALFNEPWLIEGSTHQAMQDTLLARINSSENLFDEKADQRRPATGSVVSTPFGSYTVRNYSELDSGVAHIPVSGILSKKLSTMETMCGGYDMGALSHALGEAIENDKVKAVMLDIHSPGGSVIGTEETGALIAQAASIKPVYAFTETMAASAAYWLASQCTHIFTTPSAMLGSIGVYMAMPIKDEKIELIKSGRYKAMGVKPLSADERKIVQARVDATHAKFKQAVMSKRPVGEDVLEGLSYTGEQAIENGLADSLVLSFDEAVELVS